MSTPQVQPDTPRRRQFGLKQLFVAVAVAGAVFGILRWTGPYGAVVFGGFAAGGILGYAVHRSLAIPGSLLGLLLAIGLLPSQLQTRGPARRSQCSNNLRQIGLGLQTYADNSHFFPADFTSYGGEPAGDEVTPDE